MIYTSIPNLTVGKGLEKLFALIFCLFLCPQPESTKGSRYFGVKTLPDVIYCFA